MSIYPLIRQLLFKLDAERAHRLTLGSLSLAGSMAPVFSILKAVYSASAHPVQAFGLTFKNPLGLAAGYDKDGTGWRGLSALGFSHIEVGTVTPQPQYGNPKPRIFRLPNERALINRMGFPGLGVDFVAKQLDRSHPAGLVLGVNIGKNKDTPLETAVEDYLLVLRRVAAQADYVVVNISSPNTVGLRRLQEKTALERLLGALMAEKMQLSAALNKPIPMLVKLAPDLSDSDLDDALQVILQAGLDGVIATNTTLSRENVFSPVANESGGLSGAPLFARSLAMVNKIHQLTQGKLPVIGVGGINNATGVHKMLDAGAVLVQIYTGLIYEGPGLVKQILREL